MYPDTKDCFRRNGVKDRELNFNCPNCAQKTIHKATWGDSQIYACPNCHFDWEVKKGCNGEIESVERLFFG